jgi:hypothetical protein
MMKCWYNCGTDIMFDDGARGKTGKKIPLNLDGTRHDCPNSPYKRKVSQTHSTQPPGNQQSEPSMVMVDKLLQKEKVNDAIKYIDGLKERVPDYELELVVKERGGSLT